MSAFTRRLKNVLEDEGGSYEMRNGVWIIDKPEIIGLDTYPIFDEGYRKRLNGLIFGEYMNREIAHETAQIFRNRVRNHMLMHMPIFNKMYNADLHEISPLLTNWSKTVGKSKSKTDSENTGTGTSDSGSDAKGRSVASETPQGLLKAEGDYATSASDSFSNSKTLTTNTEKGSALALLDAASESEYEGFSGQAIDLIEHYKRAVSSVDYAVVSSLNDFFMFLYSNNNTMTERYY